MNRIRSLVSRPVFAIVEVTIAGLFFVQTLRHIIGLLYARASSATVVSALGADSSLLAANPAAVGPEVLSSELSLLGAVLGAPVLMILVARFRWATVLVLAAIAVGRVLILQPGSPITQVMAAELVLAGGLAYIVALVQRRAKLLPLFFVLGFSVDQLLRAYGNTYDPSMRPDFLPAQAALSALLMLAGIFANVGRDQDTQPDEATGAYDTGRGILTFWGGIGMGALLFLQLSLLALPNAIAGRTDADYTLFVPLVLAATFLPAVPFVRQQARFLLSPFDSTTRGWMWFIAIAVLIVVGLRIPRINVGSSEIMVGAFLLTIAQLFVSLLWWWLVRPRAARERNFTGIWVATAGLVLMLFLFFDLLTYDYAYVQGFAAPLQELNVYMVPLMRGFRGMGLAVILLAAFLAAVPMIVSTRRMAWAGGSTTETVTGLAALVCAIAVAMIYSRPIAVTPVLDADEIIVGTYNIHGGYSEFYELSLEGIARTIAESGATVVLLQDVEAGRLTSFGIDQTLWLARVLGMDRRFYPTNEGLLGLAVLSKVPIVYDDGFLLPSLDRQTGVQRVQIQPDEDVVKIYNTSFGQLLAGGDVTPQEINQTQQMEALLALLRTHIEVDYRGQLGRTIVGGTLNNVPDAAIMQTLRSNGFNDPFAGAPRDRSDTLFRHGQSARVDYLWLWRDTLTATGYVVLTNSTSSPHRMAVIRVEL
jgi:endonuclease/exonuclease/phosphatase family metal-dependent hydrolase